MHKTLVCIIALAFTGLSGFSPKALADGNKDWILWYTYPAREWEEALPVGNGRLGGMIWGGIDRERISLNEESIWSGAASARKIDSKNRYLVDQQRKLFFEGQILEANNLKTPAISGKEAIVSEKVEGINGITAIYKPLADLYLHFGSTRDLPTDYHRELDISTAISTVSYKVGDVNYKRETFASFPDQVIVVRLTADKPGSITFDSKMTRRIDVKDDMYRYDAELGKKVNSIKRPKDPVIKVIEPGLFSFSAQAEPDGVKFTSYFYLKAEGGETSSIPAGFRVENADAATIYISCRSDFNFHNFGKVALEDIKTAIDKPYEKILSDHIADHQALFNRMDISLEKGRISDKPTDKRVLAFQLGVKDPRVPKGAPRDNDLYALYFQYGRYLMIASSREGTMPPALQGIWNDSLLPPWYGNHTSDINVEMNYWLAESCNLSECHRPLLDFAEKCIPAGKKSAEISYGTRGMVFHGINYRGLKTSYGGWQDFAGWLAQDYWNHYDYIRDVDYLKNHAYPFIKECALFYLDFLCEDPNTGYLVSGPSYSPENVFFYPDGKSFIKTSLSMGTTMSRAIIHEVFSNAIKCSEILDVDPEFRQECAEKMSKLMPYKINSEGRLQEWSQDFREVYPGHRHLSHLYALAPGSEFTKTKNKELTEAARQSMLFRLENNSGWTGWSRAWMINLAARLGDGNLAGEQLELMMARTTLYNLFDTHPRQGGNTLCFQIEGNFGATAGIAEMLMQSHDSCIDILPAKPDNWRDGYIKGLCARGGFEIDIKWNDGKLSHILLKSKNGGPCIVRYQDKTVSFDTAKGESYKLDGQLAMI